MILMPTYSGVFDTDKKTCLVFFDGKFIPLVCNKFEPICIANLTQYDISKGIDSCLKDKIVDYYVDCTNEDAMINFIRSLEQYNIIFYTEDLTKIDFFIKNNLYGFRMQNVGLGTCVNQDWDIRTWYDYVKQLEQKSA